MNEHQMLWQNIGTLNKVMESKYQNITGVYLEIFPGDPRRIIYVGTTDKKHFSDRPGNYWNGSKDGYLKKKHYAFNATTNEDIYEQGMRVGKGQTRQSYSERVKGMWLSGKLWIPGWESKSGGEKLWEKKKWAEHIMDHFKDVELWGCEIPEPIKAMETESRHQVALGKLYRLGYYTTSKRQNWLGKIECFDDKAKYPGLKKRFQNLEFSTIFNFSEDNFERIGLYEDTRAAFREETNKDLIKQYFELDDDKKSF